MNDWIFNTVLYLLGLFLIMVLGLLVILTGSGVYIFVSNLWSSV